MADPPRSLLAGMAHLSLPYPPRIRRRHPLRSHLDAHACATSRLAHLSACPARSLPHAPYPFLAAWGRDLPRPSESHRRALTAADSSHRRRSRPHRPPSSKPPHPTHPRAAHPPTHTRTHLRSRTRTSVPRWARPRRLSPRPHQTTTLDQATHRTFTTQKPSRNMPALKCE